jgi:hypothetical protein
MFAKLNSSIRGMFEPASGFEGFAKGAKTGYGVGFKGNLPFFIAFGAYAVATAPRGHKLSALAGGGVGFGATAVVGGAIAGAFGIPPTIGALAAGFIFGNSVDEGISNTVQSAVDFGSNMRKARFGGDYRDTQTAVTMRQAAAREMSRSLMNARQWLGQEGAFMHQ